MQKGFSLLEMLMVLGILAIMSIFVLTGFGAINKQTKQSLATQQVLKATQFARLQAMSSGQRVSICLSDDGRQCERDAKAFLLVSKSPNHLMLKRFEFNSPAMWHWKSFPVSDHLTFNDMGFAQQNGSFSTVLADGNMVKIIVGRTGKIRLSF